MKKLIFFLLLSFFTAKGSDSPENISRSFSMERLDNNTVIMRHDNDTNTIINVRCSNNGGEDQLPVMIQVNHDEGDDVIRYENRGNVNISNRRVNALSASVLATALVTVANTIYSLVNN